MKNPRRLAAPLLLAFSQAIFAQSPVANQQWIGTGHVRALVKNNGTLASDFQVPGPGGTLVSSLNELSLWTGGFDEANNLNLDTQSPDTTRSHFRGGFPGIPGSNKVWKVTKKDIRQHRADWADNHKIDHPNPAILAWPGGGNPNSLGYNGFSLDSVGYDDGAPFRDLNGNWRYEPNNGEYPRLDVQVNGGQWTATWGQWDWDELVFVPFVKKNGLGAAHTANPKLSGNALYYTYYCDDLDLLKNTVFGRMNLHYEPQYSVDSFFVSFYVDGKVGKPSDDYLGFRENTKAIYFYNSDPTNDAAWGNNPPIIGFGGDWLACCKLVADWDTCDWRDVFTNHFMPILDTWQPGPPPPPHDDEVDPAIPIYPGQTPPPPLPPAVLAPQAYWETYNYLTGSWRDGTPLTLGGMGYSKDPAAKRADYAYPGIPDTPGDWSELNAKNVPGDRAGLLAYGPLRLVKDFCAPQYDRHRFSLYFVPGGQGIAAQVRQLDSLRNLESVLFYADYFPPAVSPFDSLECLLHPLDALEPHSNLKISLSPNPATDLLHLEFSGKGPASVTLFDELGRQVFSKNQPGAAFDLPVASLPAGLYFLQWKLENGQTGAQRVVVAKN